MTIKGKRKNVLSVENVMRRITPYDIFRFYMKKDFDIGTNTYSPFRQESEPSFLISNRYGFLHFIDFGDTSMRGDCFDFVMCLYPEIQNVYEALIKIDKDFGLGIMPEHATGEWKRIKAEYKQPEEVKGKRYVTIQVMTRKFTNEELAYWNEYYQDIQDLRDNNIYSISKLFLNRKRFGLKETELRFGYLYGNTWKIYRPFATKKNKWMPNNVPITEMDGKEDVVNCDTVFINKSKKDYMVMKKILSCTCAIQNEGVACFSKENVKFLKDNSKRQILSFDSDVAGVKNSQQITKLFNFDYCNVPRKYLSEDIKDWADLAKAYDLMKKEYNKIYKKEMINSTMIVMRCPKCGNICASGSEKWMLPKFAICDNKRCEY